MRSRGAASPTSTGSTRSGRRATRGGTSASTAASASADRVNAVVYLDVQNVLDRENVFGLEYTEDPAEPDRLREQTNVGRLPTIGFSVEF